MLQGFWDYNINYTPFFTECPNAHDDLSKIKNWSMVWENSTFMTRNTTKNINLKAKETTVVADVKSLINDINAGNFYGAGMTAATIAKIAYPLPPWEDLTLTKPLAMTLGDA